MTTATRSFGAPEFRCNVNANAGGCHCGVKSPSSGLRLVLLSSRAVTSNKYSYRKLARALAAPTLGPIPSFVSGKLSNASRVRTYASSNLKKRGPMSLSDIASRQPVLDAVAELDQLGRDQFLQKYGFGHSRSYWLIHNGQRYDSKAITGAAPGYVRPGFGSFGCSS